MIYFICCVSQFLVDNKVNVLQMKFLATKPAYFPIIIIIVIMRYYYYYSY